MAEAVLAEMAEKHGNTPARRTFLRAQGMEQLRPADADDLYVQARSQSNREDIRILYSGASHFVRRGRHETALEWFSQVAELATKLKQQTLAAKSHLAMATLHAELGQMDKAEAEIRKGGVGEDAGLSRQLHAILLIRAGELDKAQQILEDMVLNQRNPESTNRLLLASLYTAQGARLTDKPAQIAKWDLAEAQYEELCFSDPQPSYRLQYASLLMRRANDSPAKLRMADEQLKALEKEHAGLPVVARSRCVWLQRSDRRGEIVKVIENLVAQHKDDKDEQKKSTLLEAGRILASFNFHQEAGPYFEQAKNIDEKLILPFISNLAQQGRTADAIDQCLKLTEAPVARATLLANAVVASGQATPADLKRIQPHIEKALKDERDSLSVRLSGALFHLVAGNQEEAVALYRGIIKQSPNNPVALNNLAAMLGEDGRQIGEAETHIDAAIDAHGRLAELLDTKAMILVRKNELGNAVELLQQATDLQLFPNPLHEFHLAVALARAGEHQSARQRYTRSKANGLGQQLLTTGDRELVEELERLLMQDPS